MHTEITTPQERKYKERRIIPARNQVHAREMDRQIRRLHIDYLRQKLTLLGRLERKP